MTTFLQLSQAWQYWFQGVLVMAAVGIYTQAAGTLRAYSMTLGANVSDAVGRYYISGGTCTVTAMVVGNHGDGTVVQTGGAVTLESVKTSWFGGTSLSQLRIKDPVGRQIACHSLVTRMSLLNFLRGKYDLGDVGLVLKDGPQVSVAHMPSERAATFLAASSLSSLAAPEAMTPPPAYRMGLRALAISSEACLICLAWPL